MEKLIDLLAYPVEKTLNILLKDKTTRKNILWATDTYRVNDSRRDIDEIKKENLMDFYAIKLQARTSKTEDEQQARTRKKAEVFTPVWMCNKMNNYLDSEWFGEDNVFNIETEHNWNYKEEKITFSENDTWKKYVDSRRLEITCGEAPFLVSRYDVSTGEFIYPLKKRIGILDRKLRVVNENVTDKEEWMKWVERAFQSCYGFEFQGDNLIIARINFIMTFYEYYKERWKEEPDVGTLRRFANIISWNLWQMDGFTDSIPKGLSEDNQEQINMFDAINIKKNIDENKELLCKIQNWRAERPVIYQDLKKRGLDMSKNKKLFDYVIGNPPYQDSTSINNRSSAVYPLFYDISAELANRYLLISPARFLFNTGLTSKEWNKKMLLDEHLKVIEYEPDASSIFPNTDIKGGIAIMYHDWNKEFGAIEEFIPNENLRSIATKFEKDAMKNLPSIMYGGRSDLKFSDKFLNDYPESINDRIKAIKKKHNKVNALSPNEEYELKSSTFEVLPYAFFDNQPTDGKEYYNILGLSSGKRFNKWIKKEYMVPRYPDRNNIDKYKVFVPESNGSGKFGEILSSPVVANPYDSCTPTFISIGCFESRTEAENVLKYIKTKLCRALLGIMKKTQHNSAPNWAYIPLQNFTSNSDIDWSKSISEIDKQLYKKYNLSADEIDFIENNVKEME